MSNFLNGMKQSQNVTRTENGAVAYNSTMSAMLDLFSTVGSMRGKSEKMIINAFDKAFQEDALLATKCAFWVRDVRGGNGEREIFRVIAKYLANTHPEYLKKNIWLFGEYGRYDDLLCLLDTPLKNDVLKVIKNQLKEDYTAERPSLLAKWLPSESSRNSQAKAELARSVWSGLGMHPKDYRNMLTELRAKLGLVETMLCEKKFDEIMYDKIPSRAGMVYRKAFMRNDEIRYCNFIEMLTNGEVKVNSSTLYPYEIISKLMDNPYHSGDNAETKLMDGMWNNLPDYFDGNDESAMAVIDTSGSMTWENDAIAYKTAIALGIYMAERSKGAFKNHFMTFSDKPQLIDISNAKTIREKFNIARQANAYGGTNIEAMFDLILNTAVNNNLSQSEIPSRLFILTDGHFNQHGGRAFQGEQAKSLTQKVKAKFEASGYEMPTLVYWLLDVRTPAFPATMDESGIQMISGHSPSLFKNLLAGKDLDSMTLMREVLESERYQAITV